MEVLYFIVILFIIIILFIINSSKYLSLFYSMALNYKEYSRDWFTLATSLPSDSNYDLIYDSRVKT